MYQLHWREHSMECWHESMRAFYTWTDAYNYACKRRNIAAFRIVEEKS